MSPSVPLVMQASPSFPAQRLDDRGFHPDLKSIITHRSVCIGVTNHEASRAAVVRAPRFCHRGSMDTSLSRAAEELGVTHGAVSRQISKLEQWAGQDLFIRQGR